MSEPVCISYPFRQENAFSMAFAGMGWLRLVGLIKHVSFASQRASRIEIPRTHCNTLQHTQHTVAHMSEACCDTHERVTFVVFQ